MHFAQLPDADDAVVPGVVSSDIHGNQLITIATQTTEVVMTTDCEHAAVVENVRGCSKAATPQQLSDFYHGAWPIVVGEFPLTVYERISIHYRTSSKLFNPRLPVQYFQPLKWI